MKRPLSHVLLHRGLAHAALLLCCLSLLAASCSKGYNKTMRLPQDPQAVSELGWAVVKTAYARLKTSPDAASGDAGLVRGKSVFRCTARSIDPKGLEAGGLWYKFSEEGAEGWLHQDELAIFDTEAQAKKAAQAISDG
ncbi:MAG: hypothetical protein PHT55_05970 [Spirochaetales bacterium]|nr:hypothetical protein [Spirochaetales bacterium]